MRRGLGRALFIASVIALGAFFFVLTAYRFKNEALTETQLAIWCFQRWWAWVPSMVVAGLGLWIARQPRKSDKR